MEPSASNLKSGHEMRILVIYTILLVVATVISGVFFYDAGYKNGIEYMRIISRQEAIENSTHQYVPTPTQVIPSATPTIASSTAKLTPISASRSGILQR